MPDFHIKQSRPYRTRIRFPFLKRRQDLCTAVQVRLLDLEQVGRVQARPASGSVILEHPDGPVDPAMVAALVYKTVEKTPLSPESTPSTGDRAASRCSVCHGGSISARKNHVSGPVLLLSGLYILFLFAGSLLTTSVVATTSASTILFTLPALVALALSLPIQRQALRNFKKTGKPDMGLISTGLLYLALFTGNVLAALVVFWLFNLSSWLEDRIKRHTRKAVRAMLKGRVTTAWLVLDDGTELEVNVDSLGPGDIIRLRSGSVIPVDGMVVDGQALVNESTLTGESLPVAKEEHSPVLAGTTIEEGDIQVRVEKAGEETRLAAIIRLIETAENDPGELQLTSQRFSQAVVPVSAGLAIGAFIITGNILQAMAVLIITCPCALRLSTSVAVSAAMSRAAGRGILIKGGRYVEIAGKVNILVLDKTGTLTDTVSEITRVRLIDKRFKEETLIRLAAGALQSWSHPLSRAATSLAEKNGMLPIPCSRADLVVGQGVRARTGKDNQEVLVGSRRFMENNNIISLKKQSGIDQENGKKAAGSRLYIAKNGQLVGLMETENRIFGNIGAPLNKLRAMGVEKIVLLTGDNEAGIVRLQQQYDFDKLYWEQSPEDKAHWIKQWKISHPEDVIAMVGDGINDTPAFAAADLSLAIGRSGADVTVEYADIVLQPGTLEQVAETLGLGRRTLQTIKECYTIAISLNGATLALTTLGIISPVAGALLHNMITVAAVTNAGKAYEGRCLVR